MHKDEPLALLSLCIGKGFLDLYMEVLGLNSIAEINHCPYEHEIDMRGDKTWDRNKLTVRLGEFKSSHEERAYERAVQQLRVRFRCLSLAAKLLYKEELKEFVGIGYVHMPDNLRGVYGEKTKTFDTNVSADVRNQKTTDEFQYNEIVYVQTEPLY
jgi:hypothetical protein